MEKVTELRFYLLDPRGRTFYASWPASNATLPRILIGNDARFMDLLPRSRPRRL
jgi:hypothetical protein